MTRGKPVAFISTFPGTFGSVCGPTLAWDWLVLDISYVLVLVGGGIVLRTRNVSLITWMFFGLLSVAVGGLLFSATYLMGQGQAAIEGATATASMLSQC